MAQNDKKNETPTITWEEPPPSQRGRKLSPRLAAIADALKARPNEWAKVSEGETNDGLATSIRRGRAVAFRDGKYEARSAKQEDRTYTIYARYLGE